MQQAINLQKLESEVWESPKLVISLHQDTDKKEHAVWPSGRKTYLSQWTVSFLIWSLIPIVSPPEWQSVTLSKLSSVRWLHWRVASKKMQLLSGHSTFKKKLSKFINLVTKSTEMKLCSTRTVAKNLRIWSSLGQFTTKDWDIWLMIKCMQDQEVQSSPLPDNQHTAEVEQEVWDSVRWREIVSFRMVSVVSWKKDFA